MNKFILVALITSSWVNLACGMNKNMMEEDSSTECIDAMNMASRQNKPNTASIQMRYKDECISYKFNVPDNADTGDLVTFFYRMCADCKKKYQNFAQQNMNNTPQIVMNDVSTPLADVAAPQQQNINQQGINDQGNYAMEPIIQNSAPTDTPPQDILPPQNDKRIRLQNEDHYADITEALRIIRKQYEANSRVTLRAIANSLNKKKHPEELKPKKTRNSRMELKVKSADCLHGVFEGKNSLASGYWNVFLRIQTLVRENNINPIPRDAFRTIIKTWKEKYNTDITVTQLKAPLWALRWLKHYERGEIQDAPEWITKEKATNFLNKDFTRELNELSDDNTTNRGNNRTAQVEQFSTYLEYTKKYPDDFSLCNPENLWANAHNNGYDLSHIKSRDTLWRMKHACQLVWWVLDDQQISFRPNDNFKTTFIEVEKQHLKQPDWGASNIQRALKKKETGQTKFSTFYIDASLKAIYYLDAKNPGWHENFLKNYASDIIDTNDSDSESEKQ